MKDILGIILLLGFIGSIAHGILGILFYLCTDKLRFNQMNLLGKFLCGPIVWYYYVEQTPTFRKLDAKFEEITNRVMYFLFAKKEK